MGGKNAIIVDADADLDDAVPAIVTSSFVYAGQKCSACERVLVHEAVHDALVERLAGAVAALRVGPADDFATDVGPVIDDESRARLLDRIATARREGRVVAEQTDVPPDGHYVPPTVVAGLPADSVVLTEELFGPVVAVTAVPSLDAALEEVDRSPFALTGGVFSRSPSTIDEVVRRSPVGNLYVNRHITGAMVGRQPFGGNRRSGTGDKAGGPDYLRQFADPRVITENTVRHGLVADA
jgi:RHH-type proline utilization regulon transcriptional repressor/proline dehydrogenase/delta 1-pyrroline-5-carboxylate dehydrogenase